MKTFKEAVKKFVGLFSQKTRLTNDIKTISDSLVKSESELSDLVKSFESSPSDDMDAYFSSVHSLSQDIKKAKIIRKEYGIKLAEMLSKGGELKYKDYMKDSLGRARESMPQVDSKNLTDYLLHFQDKVGVSKVSKKASSLKPSQNEMDEDKVLKMISDGEDMDNTYVISSDNYIVDGHHRWAKDLEEDDSKEVSCYKVELPIKELLKRSNLLKLTRKEDINGIEKSEFCFYIEEGFPLTTPIHPNSRVLLDNDLRPIPADDFIRDIVAISKAHDAHLISDEVFEKARKGAVNPLVARRVLARNHETGRFFFTTREINPNKHLPNNGDVENAEPVVPAVINIAQEDIAKYDRQKSVERVLKHGDIVDVNVVGLFTGANIHLKNLMVTNIKADSIVVRIPETIHIQTPTKTVVFLKNVRLTIPRTNNPKWSRFQNLDFDISDEELEERIKRLSMGLNKQSIEQANALGFSICTELVGKTEAEVSAFTSNFNSRFAGFSPLTMFQEARELIKSHFRLNNDDDVKYEFSTSSAHPSLGFSISKAGRFRISRHAGGNENFPGKVGISHDYFSIARVADQGGGFAKDMFKAMYKQYKNAKIPFISVHANIDVGGYTWARLGFCVDKSTASSMVNMFSPGIEKTIKTGFVRKGVDNVADFKVVDGKCLIKRIGSEDYDDVSAIKTYIGKNKIKAGKLLEKLDDLMMQGMNIDGRAMEDYEGDDKITPEQAEELKTPIRNQIEETNTELDAVPMGARYVACRNGETQSGDIYDHFYDEKYTITQDDADKAKRIYQTWKTENPGSNRFPAILLSHINNGKAGKAAMLGSNWYGTVDLENDIERKTFENAIGYDEAITPSVTIAEKPVTKEVAQNA